MPKTKLHGKWIFQMSINIVELQQQREHRHNKYQSYFAKNLQHTLVRKVCKQFLHPCISAITKELNTIYNSLDKSHHEG